MGIVSSGPNNSSSRVILPAAPLPTADQLDSNPIDSSSFDGLNFPAKNDRSNFEPLSNRDFQFFLDLEYGETVWRYWDSVPQNIKNNFSNAESNPIWTHSLFLERLENKLLEVSNPVEQQKIFNDLAIKTFGKESLTSVAQYLPAVQKQLEYLKEFNARVHSYQDQFIAHLSVTRPDLTIENNIPLSTQQQISDFAKNHPDRPIGRGMYMGEYGVAHSKKGTQVLATDFLMDCIAVVLTSQNPNDPSDRYSVLAHIDATTDLTKAVPRLLSEIPDNHKITCYVLGSKKSENIFLNTSAIHELTNDQRVDRIAVNTSGPTTVVVHNPSGTVLTAYDPNKSEGNAYSVTNLPVDVTFSDKDYNSYRDMNWDQLNMKTPMVDFMPTSKLTRVCHPYLQNENHSSPSVLLDSAKKVAFMSKEQMLELANEIKEQLATDDVRIHVVRENGEPSTIEAQISNNPYTGKPVELRLGYCFNMEFEQDSVELSK